MIKLTREGHLNFVMFILASIVICSILLIAYLKIENDKEWEKRYMQYKYTQMQKKGDINDYK